MSDPILCRECGHDIDKHRIGDWGADNCHECFDCPLGPSDIALDYADERVREAMDSHRCDATTKKESE